MSVDPASLPYRPCVGIVLINSAGRLFIGRRADIRPDAWQMPQGGVDKGEDPRSAGFRELVEETGIAAAEFIAETDDWLTYDLPPDVVGKAMKGRYRGQRQKWILARFTGSESDIDLAGHDIEFDDWKWAGADEVLDRIVEFKRPVYEAVIERFATYLKR